jgi:glutaredoxin 3
MKKIVMLALPGCPYCAKARKAIRELREEHPDCASIEVEEIEDESEAARPYQKDYYYVPSLFIEGKKCFEAQPGQDYDTIKQAVAEAFAAAKNG